MELEQRGNPRGAKRQNGDGEAVRATFARANVASSAATELRKIIGVKKST